MAWLTQQLRLEQKKPLVSGYIREECHGQLLVPTDLIKIIRWYLDEVLYWSMSGKFLHKFCNKKVGQILYSSTYNYNEFEFCNYWYPNGNSAEYAEQVIFGVTLTKLPAHISSITIYYRLQCNEFNCLWKSIHTFHVKEIVNNSVGWNPFNLRLSKCQNAHKIDFNCYVNVIRVVNKQHQIDTQVECIDESMQITKFEWTLSRKQLKQFRRCELGKTFYSRNFGKIDNYCLFLAPKGFNQNKDAENNPKTNHLMLFLRLLRLPINIRCMTICYHIKANYTLRDMDTERQHVTVKETQSVKVGYDFNRCTKQCLVDKIANVTLLSALSIELKITVMEIVDMNDKVIPKVHWEKYGIVLNDSFAKIKNLTKIKLQL